MFSTTFFQVLPLLRVTWTFPSSVPHQMIPGTIGDSEIVIIVQWISAPVLSSVIGPPESFCFSGSLVERSGLMTYQDCPPFVVLNKKFPPL